MLCCVCRAETEAILVGSGIRWQPFSEAALAELPKPVLGSRVWHPAPKQAAGRRDLRGPEYFVCSIDPPGCTDVDDALSARRMPGGGLEVGVHIADVSSFVQQVRLEEQIRILMFRTKTCMSPTVMKARIGLAVQQEQSNGVPPHIGLNTNQAANLRPRVASILGAPLAC